MPREREMSTASASSASSSSSAATTSARAVSYGISNSRYGRHRARSQLGHADGASSSTTPTGSSYNEASGSYMAMAAPSSTSASSPPPPPPPPYSSAYEPVTASTKPTITRSTSGSSAVSSRAHRSPTTTSSKSANRRRQPSGSNGAANSTLNRREANGSLLSDDETSGSYVESPTTGPSGSSPLYPMATRGNSTRSSAALLSTASARFDTAPPMMERSCSASPASRHRHESSSSHSSLLSSMASVDGTPRRHARKLANDNDDQAGDETPRRRARKVMNGDDDDDDDDGISNDSDDRRNRTKRSGTAEGTNRGRPVRIKYESTTRGVGGGKREISHASLGKLIARLTDAHQYDAEFRDVFLLTYRCFCSPYDFIKKLMKRYTAVLTMCGGLDPDTLKETQKMLEQITQDEELETDRSSSSTSISTARSDINTGMEANVSIMRLLSVIKYWIKESGFIEMDLLSDRRAQRKLLALLQEIQSTTPVASIRQHAESLLMSVSQLIRQQNAPSSSPPSGSEMKSFTAIPGPPQLTHSTSQSSVSSDHESKELTQSMLSSAMSKLKLTRSSSDSKKDRSTSGAKPKHSSSSSGADAFTPGSYDPANTFRRGSPRVTAPKMLRGITIGSMTDSMASSSSNPLEDVIQDTIQRARLTASRSSSRTSYDNVQPLSGVSAQDMADQLTLIEAECFFARINHRELTNKAWTRETKHKDAPHVMALIELFDGTAEWVSSEILHPQLQAAERARLIMLFIDAGDACYQLNNFNSLFEITTGLSAPCIRQLNTTWGLVSAASVEKYQVLMQVCSPEDNYRNYRQAFALAEGQPRLPCSFILVKDLFTIEEAMKSIEDGLVNWQKYRKVHKAISEALERQNLNYLPADGSSAAGISRKGKGALRHDRKVQLHIRHRLDTIRKDSTVLYQLARNANTQESIMFVNSLSEAGFL